MGLQLVLCLERNVALLTAAVVGALEVRARKVNLKRFVIVVEHVPIVLTAAEMARQMHAVNMILKLVGVEEKFLTEVTPRVG